MSVKSKLKMKIHKRDGFRCHYCGKKFIYSELHVDHMYPRSKDRRDKIENLVTACIKCNTTKSDSTPEEFLLRSYRKHKELQEKRDKSRTQLQYDKLSIQIEYFRNIIENLSSQPE